MVRGRGYSSRGGGRGNSYRSSGSTYNRMGGSRNDTSYRGGNSRYNSSYNSYDSRSRDKFNSRYENRHDNKRSYRDNSRDRSDDRKRPRQEDSRPNSNYASTSSYRNRNDTSRNRLSSPSGGGGATNYQGRGSSSAYHRGQREGSSGRRHTAANDSMGPPKRPVRSSYVVRPRGSGTASRVRGTGTARGGMRVIRKESSDMRIMRRKLLLAQQRDRARLLKIARLTSSLRKRKPRSSESPSGRSKSRGGDKKSENEEEEEGDEEEEIEEGDGDGEVDDETGKAKEKRVKKKSNKSVKKDPAGEGVDEDDEEGKDDGEEEEDENDDEKPNKNDDTEIMDDDDEEVVEADDDETKEGKNTSVSKSGDAAADAEKTSKDASKEKKDKDRKEDSSKDSRRKRTSKSPVRRPRFIKLTCVHCRMNCVTFKEYTGHLFSRTHKVAMRRVAIRQRVTLARIRTQQRNAQREIEEKSKEELDDVKPQFCMLCRLNYRQAKAKHQLSEHHKNMKKILMPYCQTCHVAFKSPMLYEAHRCSLEHIRRKARSTEASSDVSGDEEKEVDLKNFMTVDSVGEIDDLDDEDLENHLNGDPSTSAKEKVPVGSQFIKKVEAFYCELCRTYNAVREDEEGYIKQHCGSRSHLKAFLRHREDENLQAKAERAEKKDHKQKKEKDETEKKTVGTEEVEEAGEDKLWEDVDKDLGDLLREVGPDEHDEEEEEEDESVLNIDIESEKSKPSKEVNGKKEEPPAPVVEEEKPKKDPPSTPVVKVKKEKLESKATPAAKANAASKEKKTEVAAE